MRTEAKDTGKRKTREKMIMPQAGPLERSAKLKNPKLDLTR